jgi:7-keto-8-aminopelargonate synthetase-like enzyme
MASSAASVRKLMHGSNKRAHLWENSKTLHKGLRDLGFQLGTTSRNRRSSQSSCPISNAAR